MFKDSFHHLFISCCPIPRLLVQELRYRQGGKEARHHMITISVLISLEIFQALKEKLEYALRPRLL